MALSGGSWGRRVSWCVALGAFLCVIGVASASSFPSSPSSSRLENESRSVVASSSSFSSSSSSSSSIRTKRNILQNLAVERILRDKGFVRSLINCVLDKGPCDGHGRHLKRLAPDIIRGHCPGCDRASKTHIRRVLSHVQRNFPQEWTEVMNRFLRYPSQQLHNVFSG